MKEKIITIAVPSYNTEKYINEVNNIIEKLNEATIEKILS